MSADNWATCPQCKATALAEQKAKKIAAGQAYGSVPQEKYLSLLKKAEEPLSYPKFSFREDYDLGITEDGEFYVSYQGRCEVCKLGKVFKHVEHLPIQTKEGQS